MTSHALDHNLALALKEIGLIGQFTVEAKAQTFSFDSGIQALFCETPYLKPGLAELRQLDRHFDPQDLKRVLHVMTKPVPSGRVILECAVTDDAGQQYVVQSHGKVLDIDSDGRPERILNVWIDVTALRPNGPHVDGIGGQGVESTVGLVEELVSSTSATSPGSKSEAGHEPAAGPGHLLTIGDLSRELEVSHRTIRFYEERGLITPERVGMRRLFTADHLDRLRFAARMRRLGFTVSEIGRMLMRDKQATPCLDLEMARKQRGNLVQQMASLRKAAEMLDAEMVVGD